MNPRRRHPRKPIKRVKGGLSILFLLNPQLRKNRAKDERYQRISREDHDSTL